MGGTWHRHLEKKVDGEELWHRHELGEANHDHADLPDYYPANALGGDETITMYWWSWIIMLFTAIGAMTIVWLFTALFFWAVGA